MLTCAAPSRPRSVGDADKVKYTPLTAKERFTALQSSEIDVLSRNTTWTLVRDTALGLDFAGVNYYDGQGFMVRKDLGVSSALELDGASVCTNIGTTNRAQHGRLLPPPRLSYEPVAVREGRRGGRRLRRGALRCLHHRPLGLAAQRVKLADPGAHMILPETISKEPLGPVVRHGDNQWGDVVRWSLFAMLEAEEYGVNSGNVDDLRANTTNPVIKRLLGVEGNTGESLGLPNDWAYNIVKQVGNYAESYDRNVGPRHPRRSRPRRQRAVEGRWHPVPDAGALSAWRTISVGACPA